MMQTKPTTRLAAVLLCLTVPLTTTLAQEEGQTEGEQERVERYIVIDRQRAEAESERTAAEEERLRAAEERLQAAEERLAEAAREIAEITSGVVPGAVEYAREIVASSRRPRLGVSIGAASEGTGPVEGVEILGVSPGSPAEEADIRAGDVLTRVGQTSLSADETRVANRRLLDALAEREPGDTITLELLRDGRTLTVEVRTRTDDARTFVFGGDGAGFEFDFDHEAPMVWFGSARPWGDMELVELSPGLGRYFGTDSGLLVVRAPSDPALKLEDGDVIRSIGGREPGSVSHAMRILRSYEEGEELVLDVMRDKQSRKLEVQIPASQGRLTPAPKAPGLPGFPVAPAVPRTPVAAPLSVGFRRSEV
ncbi:MAG: PDZ domain-containing protein [Gammaproteobacteria bacterium]